MGSVAIDILHVEGHGRLQCMCTYGHDDAWGNS